VRDVLGTQAAFRGSQPDFVCSPPRAEASAKAEVEISYLPVEPSPPPGASRTSSDDAINSVASTMSTLSPACSFEGNEHHAEGGGDSGNPLNSQSGLQHRLVQDVSAGACGTSTKGVATTQTHSSSGSPLTGVMDVHVLPSAGV